jgi:hypothetical protein
MLHLMDNFSGIEEIPDAVGKRILLPKLALPDYKIIPSERLQ